MAIVAAHGELAAGLVSAVAQITGRGDLLLALSNRDLGPAEIEGALRTATAAAPVRVIFTDLPAGSCTVAARRLLRERPELSLVTGVNLPALVDFVFNVGVHGPEAAAHAVEKGRAALLVLGAPGATAGGAALAGAAPPAVPESPGAD